VDVVIEAVFEDLDLKRAILADVEAITSEGTIFASNTSTLPITKIAEASSRPQNVVGMHYFSPVEKMPLLEVVTTKQTAPWVTATAVQLGKEQGKTVIVVNDGTGFYTSRVLGPYSTEATFLLQEGASVEAIDMAMEGWGFPVGPLLLADEVGIDISAHVSVILQEAFGERLKGPDMMSGLIAMTGSAARTAKVSTCTLMGNAAALTRRSMTHSDCQHRFPFRRRTSSSVLRWPSSMRLHSVSRKESSAQLAMET